MIDLESPLAAKCLRCATTLRARARNPLPESVERGWYACASCGLVFPFGFFQRLRK